MLPYFHSKKEKNHLLLFRFLQGKFNPALKKKFPRHYLISQDPRAYLKFIKQNSKKYPYFLRIDISKYFPSINHSVLLSGINLNYQQLTGKNISRRFNYILKKDLPQFLELSPCPNQGLSIGNPLSYILAGIYLLKLDFSLPVPFLRFTDDYLIFCKNKKEPELILKNIISPTLKELNLEINHKKLKSGKFHRDKLVFLGFQFYAGYITISEEKTLAFKQKIKKLTYLTSKKSVPAIIKQLNNQILGFGHYYKFGQTKQIFEKFDAFIRSRSRRYILRNRNLLPKTANLFLTNQALKNLGLKSLIEIKKRFDQKSKQKIKKTIKIKDKTGYQKKPIWLQSELIADKYRQKQILIQLNELTSLVNKIEKRIAKIEKELVSSE